ncbi:hypothetical protein FQA47_021279 [Oryzias melastigma]|uniref:Uncharacterized protein n=1 Tax=Oryzias melastigma TaxID=30732 RepID=A0A834L126_ORYME|nr:hypothetical protein FQA47_021279 [Oryzias melastigma]
MIPSPVAPPKKRGHLSEVMLHILQSAEHPNIFLQSRPFFSPVVIDCDTNCVITIGTISVLIFSKEDISDNAARATLQTPPEWQSWPRSEVLEPQPLGPDSIEGSQLINEPLLFWRKITADRSITEPPGGE